MRRHAAPRRARGFTLVEVLVALFVMAVMASIAWQGIDTMARSRQAAREAIDRTLRVGTVIAQWQADLDAMYLPPNLQSLRSLRQQSALFARTAGDDGVRIVVWAVRGGRLQRWEGPPVRDLPSLQEQWLRAQGLVGNEPGQMTMLDGVGRWETFCYNGGADLNNCGSTQLGAPRAVRLVLGFEDGSTLTRDLLVAPHAAGGT